MKEIEQHIRMSEYSNGTNPFLVNHLHFNGMTEYENAIILGTSEEIPDLDPHTKIISIILPPLTSLSQIIPTQ